MPPTAPIKPSLRAHLTVTMTEKDGEATYTVTDETTGEFLSMYAVEYAIAQRLDGERDLLAIIDSVRQDLQAEITMPQLTAFLRELHNRGLVLGYVEPEPLGPRPPSGGEEQLTETLSIHIAPRPDSLGVSVPLPTPMDDAATVASPQDAVSAGAFALVTQELVLQERGSEALSKAGLTADVAVDPDEVQRMLRDAIERMVGDDVGGAASILHAAQALAPRDDRVNALVEATQTAYARGTQEAARALKAQSATLYPELMPQGAGPTTRPDSGQQVKPPSRQGLRVAAVLACCLACGGAWWLRDVARRPVQVQHIGCALVEHHERSDCATEVRGRPIATLAFEVGGTVAQVPAQGTEVAARELVASLKWPAAVRQHLLISAQQLRQAEVNIMRLQRQREQIIEARRGLMQQGGQISRARLARKKAASLRALDKQERQVRAALLTAQNKRAQADQAQKARYESVRSLQLFAPQAAVVEQVMARVGDIVEARSNIVRLSDKEQLILSFPSQRKPLQEGAQVQVWVQEKAGRRPLEGKVVPAPATATVTHQLHVAVRGANLPFAPGAYSLAAAVHAAAFRAPKKAVLTAELAGGFWVWLVEGNRLKKLAVQMLDEDGDHVWLAPEEPLDAANITLVTSAMGRPLKNMQEGWSTRGS